MNGHASLVLKDVLNCLCLGMVFCSNIATTSIRIVGTFKREDLVPRSVSFPRGSPPLLLHLVYM